MSEATLDFGPVTGVPSTTAVQKRINDRYDGLLFTDDNSDRRALVCTICDEFLFHEKDLNWFTLTKLQHYSLELKWSTHHDSTERIQYLERVYKLKDAHGYLRPEHAFVNDLCLSPRGILKRSRPGSKDLSISCCSKCKYALENKQTPPYGIVNRNYVGCAPECLTELNEVELALITPVKTYGYCFSYVGGRNVNLKGCLTFMRVQPRKIAKAAVHLQKMGLTKHVVVLLSGRMTPSQKALAKKKGKEIRTDKVLAAVKWLIENNKNWRDNVNLEDIEREVGDAVPVIVDNSSEVESENANIENHELFTCYIPDGTLNEKNGGFDDMSSFKHYVEEMQKKNFDINLQLDLGKEFVDGKDGGDHLMSASLLQFPFGVGGLNEKRLTREGSYDRNSYCEGFLQHLSRISQPEFQAPLFQLLLYSHYAKLQLLKRSRLQLRGKHSAATLANGLTAEDVHRSIMGRRLGNFHAGSAASKKLLSAVDGCSRALPHTSEATKAARSTGESMQHLFGMASVFLTVTFDDENSLLMQVFSGKLIDHDNLSLQHLSDEELRRRGVERQKLRVSFPGFAAMNFEMLLHVLAEEVLGWSLRKNCATEKAGHFGVCEALAMAIEEQGRKTLHVHLSLWIRHFRKLRHELFFAETVHERQNAERDILRYYDHVSTTRLFTDVAQLTYSMKKATDHECAGVQSTNERRVPTVVNDQGLRHLRHRLAFSISGGTFCTCPNENCNKTWTLEEIMGPFVRNQLDLYDRSPNAPPMSEQKDIPKHRMHAAIIQFQLLPNPPIDKIPSFCINACYQHHLSCHVKGCFKCQKSRKHAKSHVCGPLCECRFRLPDSSRQQSRLRKLTEKNTWYRFDGTTRLQPLVEFLPARGSYDCFQNVSCKAISESKFSCNSNVSVITDGPLGMYQFKYQHKDNRSDETKQYEGVDQAIKKCEGLRVHEEDRKEALRLICRAAFAHNKENVIGASMASYLIRNGSRFYFSHQFVYCPVKDLMALHNKQEVSAVKRYTPNGEAYFENQALHYLCRPKNLENVSIKEFVETYNVIWWSDQKKKRKRNQDVGPWRFLNATDHFVHPSAKVFKNGRLSEAKQGCSLVEDVRVRFAKVSQWMFPDTATFGGDLLNCSQDAMNSVMDTYAQVVLTLMLPHRCSEDFKPANGAMRFRYVHRLQQQYHEEMATQDFIVFTPENKEFLQNIQNASYNSMRYKIGDDDLQSKTKSFAKDDMPEEPTEDKHNQEDQDQDDCDENVFDFLVDAFDDEVDSTDSDPVTLPQHLRYLSFQSIRDLGTKKCGYISNPEVPNWEDICNEILQGEDFVDSIPQRSNSNPNSSEESTNQREVHEKKDIVKLLFHRCTSRQRDKVFTNIPAEGVPDANATVTSIVEWAKAGNLDRPQQRAFEVLLATFLLTFFEEATDTEEMSHSELSEFRRAKNKLLRLRGIKDSKDAQLICLIHGPGGSGKTTVVNLVIAYAREYCGLLEHPFTQRTIVVTAMSGVAATLIHGETAHMAMGLNRKKLQVQNDLDMIEAWDDARLVIIDEISFASEKEIECIYEHTGVLKKQHWKHFGGLNVVFVGDFSQLTPVMKSPIYSDGHSSYFHGLLNGFIELDGRHRFRDDHKWGEMMFRFREGNPTLDDIEVINSTCSEGPHHKPPASTQYAVYYNKDRDAINSCIFESYCETNGAPNLQQTFQGAVAVFMDDLQIKDDANVYKPVLSNQFKRWFYENVSEDLFQKSRLNGKDNRSGRVDPVLKLYPGAPLMLTQNVDVPNGQANGSRVFLRKVHVKPGEQPLEVLLRCGTTIRGFMASQVQCLLLEHESKDILPSTFLCKAEDVTSRVLFKKDQDQRTVSMKGHQFPVVSNSATTGHKLQGYTATNLLVGDWKYDSNWVYVVLSRVRTMLGLYIRKPLTKLLDKYKMPDDMKRMLADFRTRLSFSFFSHEDYDEMMKDEKK